jgi:hypothetical protein
LRGCIDRKATLPFGEKPFESAPNLNTVIKVKGQLEQLIATPEPPALGPGPRPGVQTISALNQKLEEIFSKSAFTQQRQQLVRALILLWHDHLDAAHTIAQEIENADGAFVHGIMHRREPDYGNAKYWFRRVHQHAAFPEIATRVSKLPEPTIVKRLIPNGAWDAFAFVDCCEESNSRKSGQFSKPLEQIQRIETEALLNWFAQ